MNKKINIDVARFVVSFLVIAIHISPFININQEFNFFFTRILGRIAVPLFFMITGYFVIDGCLKDKNKLKKYTIKILKIYLFCIILYLPINIYMGKFNNISIFSIIKDILINGTLYHLWYFPALILGIWITYYFIKKCSAKLNNPEPTSVWITPQIFFLIRTSETSKTIVLTRSGSLQTAGNFSSFHKDRVKNITPAEAINATTAGRRPFKTPLIAPISPYFASSFANAIIIISEGVTKPAVAATAPPIPATFVPTKVAALIPIGPGVICEIATTSINSLNDIQ